MWRLMIVIFTVGLISSGCKSSTEKESPISNPTSLLDLFYGMDKDSGGNYKDNTLDTVRGLKYWECSNMWSHLGDSIKFEMSLGVYMDSVFPSIAVRRVILDKLNEVIPTAFDYDLNEEQLSLLKESDKSWDNFEDFRSGWKTLFDWLTDLNGHTPPRDSLPETIGSRGCAVAHILYEDRKYATYIIEMSVDYHSSCGCPSYADYYTIEKESGKILNFDDLISADYRYGVLNSLIHNYKIATKGDGTLKGEELIKKADGIAILNEGLLIYYHPYNIGPGSEGQHNFIINHNVLSQSK